MYSIIIVNPDNNKNHDDIINRISSAINEQNFIQCKTSVFMLYNGKIYNPPIFNNILVINDREYAEKHLIQIWNMGYVGGNIIISKKYKHFFNKYANHFDSNYSDIEEYMIITKKTNFILINKHKRPAVDFIIMGAQKAGTTSAQINLTKHPDVYLHKDEIHYFDLFLQKGLEWYKRHFNYGKKMVGEKTPELMYLDFTHPIVQSLNPSIKIILFLRNPVERAFSAWKMMKTDHGELKSFEECIEDELNNRIGENKTFNTASFHHLQRGLYYEQIKNLEKWFPKQNIHIAIFEKVSVDTANEYNKIYNFLGLREHVDEYTRERVGSSNYSINDKTYAKLKNFFMDDVLKLENMLGYQTNWFD
jgi:hypothetical protein